jgi:hypothetical protein
VVSDLDRIPAAAERETEQIGAEHQVGGKAFRESVQGREGKVVSNPRGGRLEETPVGQSRIPCIACPSITTASGLMV